MVGNRQRVKVRQLRPIWVEYAACIASVVQGSKEIGESPAFCRQRQGQVRAWSQAGLRAFELRSPATQEPGQAKAQIAGRRSPGGHQFMECAAAAYLRRIPCRALQQPMLEERVKIQGVVTNGDEHRRPQPRANTERQILDWKVAARCYRHPAVQDWIMCFV